MDEETARHEQAEQQNRAQAGPADSSVQGDSAGEVPGQVPDAAATLEDRLRRALADLDNLHKRQGRQLRPGAVTVASRRG
jgi:molecular chaperone GrpE (heat shock protein)